MKEFGRRFSVAIMAVLVSGGALAAEPSGDQSFTPTEIEATPEDVQIKDELVDVIGEFGGSLKQALERLRHAQAALSECEERHGSRHTPEVQDAYTRCQIDVIETQVHGYRKLREQVGYTQGRLESFVRRVDQELGRLERFQEKVERGEAELVAKERRIREEMGTIREDLQSRLQDGQELELTTEERFEMLRVKKRLERVARQQARTEGRQEYLNQLVTSARTGRERLSGFVEYFEFMDFSLGLDIEDLQAEASFIRDGAAMSSRVREMDQVAASLMELGPMLRSLQAGLGEVPRVLPPDMEGPVEGKDAGSLALVDERALIEFFLNSGGEEEARTVSATREGQE